VKFQPYGLAGGLPGGASRNHMIVAGEKRDLPGKITTTIARDTVIVHEQAGAGGFGDPLDRPPEAVLEDVLDGKITTGFAERRHAVVIAADNCLDAAATARLRSERRVSRDGR
jgi:N-methylhydantoinase B